MRNQYGNMPDNILQKYYATSTTARNLLFILHKGIKLLFLLNELFQQEILSHVDEHSLKIFNIS